MAYVYMYKANCYSFAVIILKGGGHANFDAEFFVPMDSLGDA